MIFICHDNDKIRNYIILCHGNNNLINKITIFPTFQFSIHVVPTAHRSLTPVEETANLKW